MMILGKNDIDGELLDTKEAALFLWGDAKRSLFYRLYRYRELGVVKTKKIGARYFYYRKELEKFVKEENAS